jgi:hypothetical protein
MAMMDRRPRFVVVNDDPIFALIEEHRAARKHLERLYKQLEDEDDPRIASADAVELGLWRRLVQVRPTTLAGVAAFAKYVSNYPDASHYGEGLHHAMRAIAAALRNLKASEREPA